MVTKRNSIYALTVLVCLNFFTAGCSKDKDEPSDSGKKAKITVSVSSGFSKAQGDDFLLHVTAANRAGEYIDWKVDGKTEKGTVITVSSDYVNGGKSNMVVESVQGFLTGTVAVSSYNIGGVPFTVSYRIELDGKVVDEKNVEIKDGDDPLIKNYQLQ